MILVTGMIEETQRRYDIARFDTEAEAEKFVEQENNNHYDIMIEDAPRN